MSNIYQFGPFRLDAPRRLLTRGDEPIPLTPKTYELPRIPVENRGRSLSRSGAITALWPNTFVEEANLSFQISTLRKALGEEGANWIETAPKHGYRFTPEVVVEPGSPPAAVPQPTQPRRWLLYGVAATFLLAGLGAVWLRFGRTPAREKPLSAV